MAPVEGTLISAGLFLIAGVDEAGRGSCAGPLVVAAVILPDPESRHWSEINDSKKLTESTRERLYEKVIAGAISYSIIEISVSEIDLFGLHRSNLEGMRRAVLALNKNPDYVLTDGYGIEGLNVPSVGIWKGDQVSVNIGAASILAKVFRDRIMKELDRVYPEYGLSKHKGYLTPAHSNALLKFGASQIHRNSFANIAALARK
jgi:ribonuclease HII